MNRDEAKELKRQLRVKKAQWQRAAFEQGAASARAEFDAMLQRFRALKELNGSGALFEETYRKSFAESDHPRDKNGQFISKEELDAAALDPEKAMDLWSRVGRDNHEERAKLEHHLDARQRALRPKKEKKQPVAVPESAKKVAAVLAGAAGGRGNHDRAAAKTLARMPEAAHARIEGHLAGAEVAGEGELADRIVADHRESWAAKGEHVLAVMERETRDAPCAMYSRRTRKLYFPAEFDPEEYRGTTGRAADPAYRHKTLAGLYAHELGHVIDGPDNEISGSAEWADAYASEIEVPKGSPPKLTAYAATKSSEGFAEFARLLYASDVPPETVAERFPKCAAVFKGRGLWPVPAGEAVQKAQRPGLISEMFSARVATPDGHIDRLIPDAVGKAQWDESQHKRDHGRFAATEGSADADDGSSPGGGADRPTPGGDVPGIAPEAETPEPAADLPLADEIDDAEIAALGPVADAPVRATRDTAAAKVLSAVGKAGKWMADQTRKMYRKLEARYGRAGAVAIAASSQVISWGAFLGGPALVGFPIYIPSAVAATPGAAIAETLRAVKGAAVGKAVGPELDHDEVLRLAHQFVSEVEALWERVAPQAKPDPHHVLLDALLQVREELDGDPHLPAALEWLRGRIADETVGKAWREEDHPRGKNGRFIGKDRLKEAQTNPAVADQLRKEVKPEDAGKLEKVISGESDPGRTRRGQAKHEAAGRRQDRAATRARADALIASLHTDKFKQVTADDLHALADHLPEMTLSQVRRARLALHANNLEAGFGGARKKAEMVASLVADARKHALTKRMEEQGVSDAEAADMRRAAEEVAGEVPAGRPEPTLQELETGVKPGGGRRAQNLDPLSRPYPANSPAPHAPPAPEKTPEAASGAPGVGDHIADSAVRAWRDGSKPLVDRVSALASFDTRVLDPVFHAGKGDGFPGNNELLRHLSLAAKQFRDSDKSPGPRRQLQDAVGDVTRRAPGYVAKLRELADAGQSVTSPHTGATLTPDQLRAAADFYERELPGVAREVSGMADAKPAADAGETFANDREWRKAGAPQVYVTEKDIKAWAARAVNRGGKDMMLGLARAVATRTGQSPELIQKQLERAAGFTIDGTPTAFTPKPTAVGSDIDGTGGRGQDAGMTSPPEGSAVTSLVPGIPRPPGGEHSARETLRGHAKRGGAGWYDGREWQDHEKAAEQLLASPYLDDGDKAEVLQAIAAIRYGRRAEESAIRHLKETPTEHLTAATYRDAVRHADHKQLWQEGDEGVFFRSGSPPPGGRSRNGKTGQLEAGVSVYPAPYATSLAGLADRPWHYGRGRVIGTGSDDEPIIEPTGEWSELSAAGEDPAAAYHRRQVESALAAGRPVPPEVLADYPDLAAKPAPQSAPAPAAPPPTPAPPGSAAPPGGKPKGARAKPKSEPKAPAPPSTRWRTTSRRRSSPPP